MYTTNRVYSVAPELRCVPPYKTHTVRLICPRPTLHTCIPSHLDHSLSLSSLSQKPRPRENVSQRWFSVFVYFSQRRLTYYRSSTDATTLPANISSVCRPVCKTATSQIACSADDTSTPLVSAVFRSPARKICSRPVWTPFAGCKSHQCKRWDRLLSSRKINAVAHPTL